MKDTSVIIPAYNESHEILTRLKKGFERLGAEVIIVDDGSESPYPKSIKHGLNYGYGAAILTGLRQSSRPLIMIADGDGQHAPKEALKLYKAFKLIDKCDMLIGARRLTGEGIIRFLGRKMINTFASVWAKKWLQDLNSGLRIIKRELLEAYAPILCLKYSITTSLTLACICDKYRVEWFPITIFNREFGKTKVKTIRDGFRTVYHIFRIGFALRTRKIRAWWRANIKSKVFREKK